MSDIHLISKKARNILFVLTFCLFSINAFGIISHRVEIYNQSVKDEEINNARIANGELPLFLAFGYCCGINLSDKVASNTVVSIFSFIALIFLFSRKVFCLILSTVFPVLILFHFVLWFYSTQKLIADPENPILLVGSDRILYFADSVAFISFFLVSLILLSSLQILLNNFFQRKKGLLKFV